MEAAIANQLAESRIVQSPRWFRTRAHVQYLGPRVSIQQRNVPFHAGLKFRIEASFSSVQSTVCNVQFKLRIGGHAAENWRHILDRMSCDGQNFETALRYGHRRYALPSS